MGGNTCLDTGTQQSKEEELIRNDSNDVDGSTDSEAAGDDDVPLAAKEADRGLSLHKRLWGKD